MAHYCAVPVSGMVMGRPEFWAPVMVTEAVRRPALSRGANETLIVQEALAARLEGQLFDSGNSTPS